MRTGRKADCLFAASAVVCGAAFYIRLHDDSLGASIFYLAAQSALIGSAADWFAVTALFRKPLGFPWHTALIPANRRRIIQGIRRMVEEKLIRPESGEAWLSSFSLTAFLERSGLVRAWGEKAGILLEKEVASYLRDHKEWLAALGDAQKGRLEAHLSAWIRERLLSGTEQEIFLDRILREGQAFLQTPETRQRIAGELRAFTDGQKRNPLVAFAVSAGESMGLIHYEDMADSISEAALLRLAAWQEPSHPLRAHLLETLGKSAERMLTSEPGSRAVQTLSARAASAVPAGMICGAAIEDALSCWDEADGAGRFVREAAEAGVSRMREDEEFCRLADALAKEFGREAARAGYGSVGGAAEAVLEGYDEERLNRFLSDKVGDELGWIRINGTIVAAAAGAVISGAAAVSVWAFL